jgi:hypothetical protein
VVEQLPYLQQMIDDFAQQNGLLAAGLVDLEGRSILLSSGGPSLRYNPLELLDERTERGFSPVRVGNGNDAVLGARLLMDIALPVPVAPSWFAGGKPEVAAILFMTVPVAEQLASLLDPGPVLGMGERFRLIQWGEQGSEQVIPGPDPRLVAFALGEPLGPGQSRPYGPLIRDDGSEYFMVGAAVAGLPWTVLHEIEARAALAPLRQFALAALALAGLAGLALALAFAAFWWRRSGAHQRQLTVQYRDLAAGIQRQRRLLESITNAMQELTSIRRSPARWPSPPARSWGGRTSSCSAARWPRSRPRATAALWTARRWLRNLAGSSWAGAPATCRRRGCGCAMRAGGPPAWSRSCATRRSFSKSASSMTV